MSSMVGLSKSRFYALIQAGIFPAPVRHASCKRPVFDLELQQKCLDIRRTGIGANGQPVLFNRKQKATAKRPRPSVQRPTNDHADLIEALKSLGLTTTPGAVEEALAKLFPGGCDGIDQGEVIRRVFLQLQTRK
jgi:hypothetical protein